MTQWSCNGLVGLLLAAILAGFALLGLILLLPILLAVGGLLGILAIIVVLLIASFAIIIILKALARLFKGC